VNFGFLPEPKGRWPTLAAQRVSYTCPSEPGDWTKEAANEAAPSKFNLAQLAAAAFQKLGHPNVGS
jgi:hypothetical protein